MQALWKGSSDPDAVNPYRPQRGAESTEAGKRAAGPSELPQPPAFTRASDFSVSSRQLIHLQIFTERHKTCQQLSWLSAYSGNDSDPRELCAENGKGVTQHC